MVLLGAAIASAETQQPLRVLSYNIHHGEGMDRKIDLPRIASVIKSVSPDFVMLQEVDRNVARSGDVDQATELGKLTEMHVVFGGNLKLGEGDYGNAILSRYPLSEVENRQLPNSDGGEPRGVLSASVTLPETHGGKTIRILGTHLDHRPAETDRLGSIDVITDFVAQDERMVIIGGDFNAIPASAVMKKFREQWKLAGSGEFPTVPVAEPTRQIDYVGYRSPAPIAIGEVRVLDEAVASDHRAILAALILSPQE